MENPVPAKDDGETSAHHEGSDSVETCAPPDVPPETVSYSGCVVVFTIISTLLIVFFYSFGRAREAARRASCQGTLSEVYSRLRSQSDEGGRGFPVLDRGVGHFMFQENWFNYGDKDWLQSFACPSAASRDDEVRKLTDRHYIYLGAKVASLEDAQAFFSHHAQLAHAGEGSPVPNFMESGRGITPLNPDDPDAAKIPVLIERPGHHLPKGGGNVIFLDGHVLYMKMGEAFPMVEEFFALIREAEQYKEP